MEESQTQVAQLIPANAEEIIFTGSGDVDYVLEVLPPIVDRLLQMLPLYAEFMKSG